MFSGLLRWRRRRRLVQESKLLMRQARRILRKYEYRILDDEQERVREAIDGLAKAVAANDRELEPLRLALVRLDERMDLHLGFARKSTLREYAESISVAVLIALFLRAFVVEAFKIPSGSMIPTLRVGDHIFVDKFSHGLRIPFTHIKFFDTLRLPKRGEVIVFIYPREPDKDFIKRIVGVGGDTVEVRDDILYVNGKPIPRRLAERGFRYLDFDEQTGQWQERVCDLWEETVDGHPYQTIFDHDAEGHRSDFPPTKVPPGEVFVMGDNRDNSHDSRYWGTVPLDHIKGQALVIWWSRGDKDGVRWYRLGRGIQ
jgi:signal peptidase I